MAIRGLLEESILLSQQPLRERLGELVAPMDSLRASSQNVAADQPGESPQAPPTAGIADSSSPVFQTLDRTAGFPYSPGEYVRRALWLIVQALLIRPSPPRAYGWRR